MLLGRGHWLGEWTLAWMAYGLYVAALARVAERG